MTDQVQQLQAYIEELENELADSSQGLVAITLELENAQEQYKNIVESSLQGIYQTDLDGAFNYVNPAYATILGYGNALEMREEVSGVAQVYVDHDRPKQISAMLADRQPVRGLLSPAYKRDGQAVILSESIRCITNGTGELTGYEVIAEDFTRQFHNEQRIMLLAKVFDYSIEGIMITDAQTNILEVNRAFSEITLYSAEEVIGKTPHILFSGWHNDRFYKQMWESLNNKGVWQGEITDRRKNGELFVQWVTICSVKDNNGEVSNYISIVNDITSKKESEKKIHQLAYYDILTQLPNRTLFYDRVEQAIRKGARESHKFGILFIDLDNFKNINDTLGHLVGDRFLIKVSSLLRTCVREEDTVARLGGDEFIILLEDLKDDQDAAIVAKNILKNLVGTVAVDKHLLSSGASIGISVFPSDGNKLDDLIKRADSAMYNAKEEGKNDYRFFTSDMNARAMERLRIETDLRKAIEEEQFQLYFQPTKHLGQEFISSAEALLRWQHPTYGMVYPDTFMSVAEESGLINQIGKWVFKSGMAQAAKWHSQGKRVQISINVSGRQLRQPHLIDEIMTQLLETNCDPTLIEFELTESAILEFPDKAIEILRKLRAQGFSIALDDFGTGYSSLSYLKQLPVDKVKIDRSFISGLPDDKDSRILVEAIIALSHKMGLSVIAEGVENEEQLDFLETQKCAKIQGYFYSRPLSVDAFEDFVRRHSHPLSSSSN